MLNANPDRLGSGTEQLFPILVPCHRSVKLHVVRRTRSVVGGGVMPLAEPMQTFAERLRRDTGSSAIQNGEAPESTGKPQ
tara:strand:- start:106046 stop:106285 length:240 start_codon:yes stop_codon:yes gene_type:complete